MGNRGSSNSRSSSNSSNSSGGKRGGRDSRSCQSRSPQLYSYCSGVGGEGLGCRCTSSGGFGRSSAVTVGGGQLSNGDGHKADSWAASRSGAHALKKSLQQQQPPPHPPLPRVKPDAYDKLVAWLVEMAANDNVPLDTSVFIKQITTSACPDKQANCSSGSSNSNINGANTNTTTTSSTGNGSNSITNGTNTNTTTSTPTGSTGNGSNSITNGTNTNTTTSTPISSAGSRKTARSGHASTQSLHKMSSSGSTDRGGASSRCSLFGGGKGSRRHAALQHNSASYESRTTQALGRHSSCSNSNSNSGNTGAAGRAGHSRSLDDAIVSRRHANMWRRQDQAQSCSRQGTCSDDPEEDSEVRNASMESLYSSSDRDSDVEAMANTYCEPTTSRRARLSRQTRQHRELRRPLIRQALLGSSTCSIGGGSGAGGLDTDLPGYGNCCSGHHHRHSLAVLGLQNHFLPCTASMGDLDKLDTGDDDEVDDDDDAVSGSGRSAGGGGGCGGGAGRLDVRCGGSGSGGKAAARAIPHNKRRSISMLNLTPPGRAVYYVPDYPLPDASPSRPPSSEMFLNDTLLDGNLADILFSVEALWPKK